MRVSADDPNTHHPVKLAYIRNLEEKRRVAREKGAAFRVFARATGVERIDDRRSSLDAAQAEAERYLAWREADRARRRKAEGDAYVPPTVRSL